MVAEKIGITREFESEKANKAIIEVRFSSQLQVAVDEKLQSKGRLKINFKQRRHFSVKFLRSLKCHKLNLRRRDKNVSNSSLVYSNRRKIWLAKWISYYFTIIRIPVLKLYLSALNNRIYVTDKSAP